MHEKREVDAEYADSNGTTSSYSLLIAISGIWSRVRLVWLMTTLCIAGYSMLAHGNGWTTGTKNHDPNVVIASLLVTVYVIAIQVERAHSVGAFRR